MDIYTYIYGFFTSIYICRDGHILTYRYVDPNLPLDINMYRRRRDRPGLTRARRPPARTAVRSTVPQQGCAARCVRLGIPRGVGRLHRAARVLADERTRPCTARAGLAHTRILLESMRMQPVHDW